MVTPRTVRNKWHEVDGVLTKYVNPEDTDLDAVDFIDELETNQGIGAASWEDMHGVVVTTTLVGGGWVQFSHIGAGSVVLQAVIDFTDYLAPLVSAAYLLTDGYDASFATDAGIGGAIGDPGYFILNDSLAAPVTGLSGKVVSLVMPDASLVSFLLGTYDAGLGSYPMTLLSAVTPAHDNYEAGVTATRVFDADDDRVEYDLYAAKPTRTIHKKLAFVDPSTSDTDYTP